MESSVREKKRKRILLRIIATLSLTGMLTSCEKTIQDAAIQITKPVKLLSVNDLITADSDSFLAQIDATYRAQLSFQVAGEISNITAKMGQKVTKGELLASLDPKDLQLALDASKAQFSLAKTQKNRAESLYSKRLISTNEYDLRETQYQAALANYEQAKTDLSYTKIHAPFSGTISYVYVKPYQIVAEKQEILNLIDNSTLDVSVTLPISYVESISLSTLANSDMWVTMDNESDTKLKAQFKEISTQPNLDTNSYEAIVTIALPEGRNLLTGMTGKVHIEKQQTSHHLALPQSVWINRNNQQGQVWVMDQKTNTVKKVTLQLDAQGLVVSGLKTNDFVVVAGIEQLTEGQMVKEWQREEGI